MGNPAKGRVCPILILLAPLLATPVRAVDSGETQRDYTILIRGHRFEPLVKGPSERPASETGDASLEPTPRIVQFDGPLTRERTGRLKERFGLRLDEYIPHYAFLERLSAAQVEALRELDFFRWSGSYEPKYKIDPMIGKHTFRTEERRAEAGILLTVVAFRGTVLAELSDRVRELGFEVISTTDEPELEILRLQVRVGAAGDAEAIARLQSTKYIEEVGEVTLNEAASPCRTNGGAQNSGP